MLFSSAGKSRSSRDAQIRGLRLGVLIGLPFLFAPILPASAGARALLPPKGHSYHGVSDTGNVRDFSKFKRQTGKHPPVMETFHGWGTSLRYALVRWDKARARPMLHISTADNYGGKGTITPKGIATGSGDTYLIDLNRVLGNRHMPTYIRPMGEMDAYWNAYCAFNANGSSRGPLYKTSWFRQAWRRMYLIIRGGVTVHRLNGRLHKLGLPGLKPHGEHIKGHRLYAAPVAFLWTPQVAGAPNIRGNQPGNYWPGGHYVDWVGTDFYSKYPNFSGLNSFYHHWRRKPFTITEWAVWGSDNPGFVSSFFHWVATHKRTRMLVYYQGFGAHNDLRIADWPKSRRKLRKILNGSRWKPFTPEWAP